MTLQPAFTEAPSSTRFYVNPAQIAAYAQAPALSLPQPGEALLQHPVQENITWNDAWRRLVTAQLRFRSALWTDGKCVVVFRKAQTPNRQLALTHREQFVLHRTLLGERQKLIACDSRIAASTVANCLKNAMLKLGFKTRLDSTPLAALLLAHSAPAYANIPTCTVFAANDGEYVLASSPRPDWSRFPDVTKSERQIATLILEGKCNTEIAQLRDTSVHTVENQVASLFRKLDASGRFDLLGVLFRPAINADVSLGYCQ